MNESKELLETGKQYIDESLWESWENLVMPNPWDSQDMDMGILENVVQLLVELDNGLPLEDLDKVLQVCDDSDKIYNILLIYSKDSKEISDYFQNKSSKKRV